MPPPTYYTIIIKPIPRGITKDDLVAEHLLRFGQIKDIRFGDGRGVSGDIMYVDYFESDSALRAVDELNGKKDPGTSRLRLAVSLSSATMDAIQKSERNCAKRARQEQPSMKKDPKLFKLPVRPEGAFKFLKSKGTGKEICLLDLDVFLT